AKLAQHRCSRRISLWRVRTRIAMNVIYVTRAHVVPTADAVHQPRWIVVLEPVRQPRRIILPPAFIEDHPHDDGRVVIVGVDHALEFKLELRGGTLGTLDFALSGVYRSVTAGHVLPDQDA